MAEKYFTVNGTKWTKTGAQKYGVAEYVKSEDKKLVVAHPFENLDEAETFVLNNHPEYWFGCSIVETDKNGNKPLDRTPDFLANAVPTYFELEFKTDDLAKILKMECDRKGIDKSYEELKSRLDGSFHTVILCGKSASGKDTILKELVDNYGYKAIVSTTTRPMRGNEKDGVDYHFKSSEEFKNLIENDGLIEYRAYNTFVNGVKDVWYYGVEKQNLTGDKNVCVLDLTGAKSFIEHYGKENCSAFYIDVPDFIREERAMKRPGFDKTEWDRRMAADLKDFSIIKVNEITDKTISNVDVSVAEIAATINRMTQGDIEMDKNTISIKKEGSNYVIEGSFRGSFADLCAEIEAQTHEQIEFGELTVANEVKNSFRDMDSEYEENFEAAVDFEI